MILTTSKRRKRRSWNCSWWWWYWHYTCGLEYRSRQVMVEIDVIRMLVIHSRERAIEILIVSCSSVSVIWALGCVVSSSKHQRSRSLPPSVSLGGPSERRCQLLVTMILVELQTAKSSSSNEWVKVVVDDADEPESWIKDRVSLQEHTIRVSVSQWWWLIDQVPTIDWSNE